MVTMGGGEPRQNTLHKITQKGYLFPDENADLSTKNLVLCCIGLANRQKDQQSSGRFCVALRLGQEFERDQ